MDESAGRFIYLIKQLELGLRPLLEDAVSREELTSAQYTALTVLARRPGLTSSELARRSFVRAQTMAETIASLMARGFITRSTDESNRRRFLLFITADGERAVEALRAPVSTVESVLLADLSKEERAAFLQFLRACRNSLGATARENRTAGFAEPSS